jgi:hypothetical protein
MAKESLYFGRILMDNLLIGFEQWTTRYFLLFDGTWGRPKRRRKIADGFSPPRCSLGVAVQNACAGKEGAAEREFKESSLLA